MTEENNALLFPERIDLDRADPCFKDRVAARRGGEGIKRCYACGACSARCPVGEIDPEFDPRRIIRLVLLGQKEDVLKSVLLWNCSTCYTCLETCPQEVGFTEILFVLKNMASRSGHYPPGLAAQVELLKEHGRLYEIGEFENKNRTDLGLPDLEENPADFQTILGAFRIKTGEDT